MAFLKKEGDEKEGKAQIMPHWHKERAWKSLQSAPRPLGGLKHRQKPANEGGEKNHQKTLPRGNKVPFTAHWCGLHLQPRIGVLGAPHFIYPVILFYLFPCQPLGMRQSRRSGGILGSRERWALPGEVGGSGELPSPPRSRDYKRREEGGIIKKKKKIKKGHEKEKRRTDKCSTNPAKGGRGHRPGCDPSPGLKNPGMLVGMRVRILLLPRQQCPMSVPPEGCRSPQKSELIPCPRLLCCGLASAEQEWQHQQHKNQARGRGFSAENREIRIRGWEVQRKSHPAWQFLVLTPRIWAPRGIPGPSPAPGAAVGAALLGQE